MDARPVPVLDWSLWLRLDGLPPATALRLALVLVAAGEAQDLPTDPPHRAAPSVPQEKTL